MTRSEFRQLERPVDRPSPRPPRKSNWRYAVSIVRDTHTIRTGVMVIRNRKDQNGRSPYDGAITFNTTGNPNTTGYALCRCAAGQLPDLHRSGVRPMGNYRYTEPAAFIDDSWKVSRKAEYRSRPALRIHDGDVLHRRQSVAFVPSLYNPAQAVKLTSTARCRARFRQHL